MTRQRRARSRATETRTEEEQLPVTPSTPPYVNPSTREFPKRPSPLAHQWVASGYRYDISTGLVSPVSKPPSSEEEEEEPARLLAVETK